MPFLKLTPRVPLSQRAQPIPHAVNPPQKPHALRSIVGLSYEEIEKAIEEEYMKRGAILLRFEPTAIPSFKLSTDGRFGIRHSDTLNFFLLFIFTERQERKNFVGKTIKDLKWMPSIQIHFYYNTFSILEAKEKGKEIVSADMQMREISKCIAKHLGNELHEKLESIRNVYYKQEDEESAKKFNASIIAEEFVFNNNSTQEEVELSSSSEEAQSTNKDSDSEGIRIAEIARESDSEDDGEMMLIQL